MLERIKSSPLMDKVRETAFWGYVRSARSLRHRWRFLLHRAYRRLTGSSSGLARLPLEIDIVKIDATSVCQLKCPACPTGDGSTKLSPIGWGHLKLEDFRALLDDNPSVRHVELSNWGEIFLNPELKEMITYAYEKKVSLSASTGVNLNTASDEVLECMVKHGFTFLRCSIDGATEETYRIYRKGGSLSAVLENIRKINLLKRKYNTDLPYMIWQFIAMGHNEHEIHLARRAAEELGVDFEVKLNWKPSHSPVKDRDLVRRETGTGAADRGEFESKNRQEYKPACHQLWLSPQVNWDGKLLGCCRNFWGDFGNVFESGLESCMQGERYVYAKEMLLGEKKPREDIPCTHCYHYKNQREPITEEEILGFKSRMGEKYNLPKTP